MLTVTSEPTHGVQARAEQFIASAAKGCNGPLRSIGPTFLEDNAYTASVLLTWCNTMAGEVFGELAATKIVEIDGGYATFQRGWRYAALSPGSMPLPKETIDEGLHFLARSQVCSRSRSGSVCPPATADTHR